MSRSFALPPSVAPSPSAVNGANMAVSFRPAISSNCAASNEVHCSPESFPFDNLCPICIGIEPPVFILPPFLICPEPSCCFSSPISTQPCQCSVLESQEESLLAPAPSPLAKTAPANAARDNGLDSDIEARGVPRWTLLRLGVSQIPPAASESPSACPLVVLHPPTATRRPVDQKSAVARSQGPAPAPAPSIRRRHPAGNAPAPSPATAAHSPPGAPRSSTAARLPPESRGSPPGRESKPAPAVAAAARAEPRPASSSLVPALPPTWDDCHSSCPTDASPPADPAVHVHAFESTHRGAFQSQWSDPLPSSLQQEPAPPTQAESTGP